ncbi:Membrane protein involved in the export of O-antigen and teichoic acid [Nannocystis exedens]|uniref:Membrane protein involved in the export of O-antigen and teichoic acid n=1 Tax=Nannocystis exedens TaxID=54 RepID=A0A1I1VW58_9BACT|nr:oligosaccharide flippase family protein [Nannocystis exedens]PCC72750.1 lipopolysaccharide biosynthesis protein [Nannocystis exedens]SFD85263.1 Membrane protein involved in the export of O-antigen and teichoic acid [Nannocystis exedens]
MSEREEQVRVNQSLAWVGTATALMGVLDVATKAVLLAIWISPEEYGVATLALAAIPILDLATELGLPGALVQQGDHTPARLSTVFWLNLLLSLTIVAAIFFAVAPLLASHYQAPIVGWMLQAHCVKLLLQNLYMVPGALMIRELRFREFSLIRFLASVAENVALLVAAPLVGIWCFIAGAIGRTLVTTAGVQYFQPWLPQLLFDWPATREAVLFGLKTSLSRILFFVYTGLDFYIVGHFFGRAALGLYKAAADLALDPARIISTVVVSVAFPAFSRARDRPAALAEQFLKLSRLSFIVVAGFLVIVVPAAPDLLLLLDERWVRAAAAVRVLAIAALLRAVSAVVPPLLDGVGRPSLTLTYMAVAAVTMPLWFAIAAILLGGWLGYASVAWAWVIGYPVAFWVLLRFALRHLQLGVGRYVRALLRLFLWTGLAIAAGAGVRALMEGAVPLPLVRALVTAGVSMGTFLAALVLAEGITPRSVSAALKPPPRDAGPPIE